jgi:AraC-like DNA-binding protein
MSYDLLVATDLPIGRIATDVGFADESHFIRRFKAVFGLTPGALRKRSS